MLAGIFVLVIGAGALAAGVGYVRTARHMHDFATARGRILTREVYDDINFPNVEAKFGSGGGFTPKFTYTYDVDGRTFTGDKYAYTARGYKRSVVEQKLAAMPEEVNVHYNPANPEEAYLETLRSGAGGWWLMALGVVLLLIGLALVAS